jgi:hypothetical protein
MPSLKSFLPVFARIMTLTPDALYGRQRALVQLGVLKGTEGRGPGSGVFLDSDNVSAMIIALMAADTLLDTDERVVRMCEAKPKAGRVCRWTRERSLRAALSKILVTNELLEDLEFVVVSRGYGAEIKHGLVTSPFKAQGPFGISPIRLDAKIDREVLRQISNCLRAETGDRK